jgi:hypothetical protein
MGEEEGADQMRSSDQDFESEDLHIIELALMAINLSVAVSTPALKRLLPPTIEQWDRHTDIIRKLGKVGRQFAGLGEDIAKLGAAMAKGTDLPEKRRTPHEGATEPSD